MFFKRRSILKRSLRAIWTVSFTILLSVSLFAFDKESHKGDNDHTHIATNTVYENTTRSGPVYSNERWKGTIDITGDVTIYASATVTIEPGTTIRFAAGSDDQKEGGDTPISDPPFPNDPAIPPSKISSINLYGGTLYAVGTDNNKIVFTSSASSPERGDWQSIIYDEKSSNLILQYTIIEYGYYGVQINTTADDSNITIKDNIIRHVVACGICGGIDPSLPVTITVSGNDISDCGHEGIATFSSTTLVIENNAFHDNLWSYGDGPSAVAVAIEGNNTTIRNNQFIMNHIGINIISENSAPDIYCNSFVDNEKDIFYSFNGSLASPTCISAIPSPTLTPSPSPTSSATPTPEVCVNAEVIAASPSVLTLKKKDSVEVIVVVTGEDNCLIEGDTVRLRIDKNGDKYVKASPKKQTTDTNGQAMFTITAKNKIGNTFVTFRDGSLYVTVKVTVTK